MDSERYEKYSSEKESAFEALCKRCGECCGASGDPCVNLARRDDGTFFCRDYEGRLGPQVTVSGKKFHCIPIRDYINHGTLKDNCAYRVKL